MILIYTYSMYIYYYISISSYFHFFCFLLEDRFAYFTMHTSSFTCHFVIGTMATVSSWVQVPSWIQTIAGCFEVVIAIVSFCLAVKAWISGSNPPVTTTLFERNGDGNDDYGGAITAENIKWNI